MVDHGYGHRQAVAVVGTRRPSEHGLLMAHRLGAHLADHGWPVVSGLAEGIDAAARGLRSAWSRGPRAVLGALQACQVAFDAARADDATLGSAGIDAARSLAESTGCVARNSGAGGGDIGQSQVPGFFASWHQVGSQRPVGAEKGSCRQPQ